MKRFKNNLGKKDAVLFIAGILASAFFLAVDLIVKQIIIEKVLYGSEIVVIKNFFSITHIRNTGAAWGIFSSKTEILTIVTIMCSGLMWSVLYGSAGNRGVLGGVSAMVGRSRVAGGSFYGNGGAGSCGHTSGCILPFHPCVRNHKQKLCAEAD